MNSKLEGIYKQIPKSTCPPHCGKCCGILFPSLAELRNVKDWLSTRNREYKDFLMTVGVDCPYLNEDKSCSIYPVRPYLCRVMGVSDLHCPLNLCQPVKVLSHSESAALYKDIYLRGKEKHRTEKHAVLIREVLRKEGIYERR